MAVMMTSQGKQQQARAHLTITVSSISVLRAALQFSPVADKTHTATVHKDQSPVGGFDPRAEPDALIALTEWHSTKYIR
jgi:hypothetical protein